MLRLLGGVGGLLHRLLRLAVHPLRLLGHLLRKLLCLLSQVLLLRLLLDRLRLRVAGHLLELSVNCFLPLGQFTGLLGSVVLAILSHLLQLLGRLLAGLLCLLQRAGLHLVRGLLGGLGGLLRLLGRL